MISYALWGVVLFRLLCPVSLESSLSLFGLFDSAINESSTVDIQNEYTPDKPIFEVQPAYTTAVEEQLPILPAEEIAPIYPVENEPVTAPTAPVNEVKVQLSPYMIVGSVWLLGVLLMAVYAAVNYIKLRRKLVISAPLKDNIYLADDIASPFVMGLIKPKIYLPSSLSEGEQPYIILHEQQHIKRLDHIIKFIAFGALCIHWFNPLVWVAFIMAGKDMEMSCDEAVVEKMGDSVRADYAASLLNLATGRRIIAGMPLAFGEGDTKSRIRNLVNWKKPAFWVILIAVVACAVLAVCLLTNPVTDKLPFDLDDIVIDSATAVDRRSSSPKSFDLSDEELSKLKSRLSELSVKSMDDEHIEKIPYYYISIKSDGISILLQSYDLNGENTVLYCDGVYYHIDDERFNAYLSDTCARLENPMQVVNGMDYLLSHRAVMSDGERTELWCSYSLEQLSESGDVYILRFSLEQNEPENSGYEIKNIRARLQLPEDVICRMAYCLDGAGVSEPLITYTENSETVIECSGGLRIETELTLTGKIGDTLDLDVTYDIAGKGLNFLSRDLDESTTFILKVGTTENEIIEAIPEVPEEEPAIPTDRRPMLYVNDILYLEYDYEKTLPEGMTLIGTVKKTVDQSELPTENLTSNTTFASVGSEIYANEDMSELYVEVADYDFDGYLVYIKAQPDTSMPISMEDFGADFLEMYFRALHKNEPYDFGKYIDIPLFKKYVDMLILQRRFIETIHYSREKTDYTIEINLTRTEELNDCYRLSYSVYTEYTPSGSTTRSGSGEGMYLLIREKDFGYELVGMQYIVKDPYFTGDRWGDTWEEQRSFLVNDPDYWVNADEQEMLDWFERAKQGAIENFKDETDTMNSFGTDFLEMYYRAMDLNEAYDFSRFTDIPLFEKYMNGLVEEHLLNLKLSGNSDFTDYSYEFKLLGSEQLEGCKRLCYEISRLYTNPDGSRMEQGNGAYLLIKDSGGSYEIVGYQNTVSDPYFTAHSPDGESFRISDPDYWKLADEQKIIGWFETRKQANIEWHEKYNIDSDVTVEAIGHGIPDVSDRPYGKEVTIFKDNTFDCDYSDYEEISYDFYGQQRSVMAPKGWMGFRYYEEMTSFEQKLTGIPIYNGPLPVKIDKFDYTTQHANDPMNKSTFFFAESPWIDPLRLITAYNEEDILKYDHEAYVDKKGRSMQVYFIDGLPKYAVYDDFYSLCIWFNLDSKEQIPIVVNMLNSIEVTLSSEAKNALYEADILSLLERYDRYNSITRIDCPDIGFDTYHEKDGEKYYPVIEEDIDTWKEWEAFVGSVFRFTDKYVQPEGYLNVGGKTYHTWAGGINFSYSEVKFFDIDSYETDSAIITAYREKLSEGETGYRTETFHLSKEPNGEWRILGLINTKD